MQTSKFCTGFDIIAQHKTYLRLKRTKAVTLNRKALASQTRSRTYFPVCDTKLFGKTHSACCDSKSSLNDKELKMSIVDPEIRKALEGIKAVFLDVDGVLTDGSVLAFADGIEIFV
uniref:3-deoxy-manno-octulosonate-8-phosphatase n=1 Tax=Aplanochytrium stocchinoi TaxID=215587 RepID=A0A7S3P9T2_9STRA